MPRAAKPCATSGCGTIVPRGTTHCDQHHVDRRRTSDRARGTAAQRGYGHAHQTRFRPDVLNRDPICVQCRTAWATIADHHPLSRRQLLDAGLDPDDPQHGRGLCKTCHDRHTATAQPGGWNTPGTRG